MTPVAPRWSSLALTGAVAGLCGGILFGIFVFAAAQEHHPEGSAAPNLFVIYLLYVIAAVAWGIGYAYMAATRPQINRLPLISGFVFGVVVYITMQLVLYAAALERYETVYDVVNGLLASCILYGLPVAFAVKVLSK